MPAAWRQKWSKQGEESREWNPRLVREQGKTLEMEMRELDGERKGERDLVLMALAEEREGK